MDNIIYENENYGLEKHDDLIYKYGVCTSVDQLMIIERFKSEEKAINCIDKLVEDTNNEESK